MLVKTSTILEVDNISKLYSRKDSSTRKRIANIFLRALFWRAPKAPIELNAGEFWSLKNISFSLKRGDAVGIIGFNGAGKTTLLRILSGQILPDGGEVRIHGQTAAMIDLTAGFSMSASGRQNIVSRGATLGFSRQKIVENIDEIIEFSELGEAIEAPFNTYSSGMRLRLAFSIMLIVEPDILFIDEILSVGDFRFRQKCLSRINELREKSAFVLVSHSMNDISRFCNHVLVLNRGVVVFEGEPEACIQYYSEQVDVVKPSAKAVKLKSIVGNFHTDDKVITNVKHFWCDLDGNEISEIEPHDDLYFKCSFDLLKDVRHLTFGLPIWTEKDGHYVTGFASKTQTPGNMQCKTGYNEYVLRVPTHAFNPGVYMSNIVVRDGPAYLYRQPNKELLVLDTKAWHFGSVSLAHTWSVIETKEKL